MIEKRAYFCVEDRLSQAVMIRLLECLLGLGKENLQELMPDYGGSSYIKSKFFSFFLFISQMQMFNHGAIQETKQIILVHISATLI